MAMSEQRRICRCGALLATDNRSAECGPCARRTASDIGTPPRVPKAFWDSNEIREALAARHFGRFLRAYRSAHEPEITQADLGHWLGLTQGQVSRIERAKTPVHDLEKLDRWAQALGVPQRRLWFTLSRQPSDTYAPSESESALRPQTQVEGDDVQRRQLLKSAGASAVMVGSTLLQGSPVRAMSERERATARPDVEIREMTQRFRRLDNRFGGGHSRSVVTSYLTSLVEPRLKETRVDDLTARSLLTAAAEMHQLAGWMSYDVGQPDLGRRHLRQALRLCQEAGDDALVSEMFAGMSHHAAYHGAPEAAVDLAMAARQAAARSGVPALQSEGAVMEAHGLALQGDKSACLRALTEAERAFNATDTSTTPQWLSYFDNAYLSAKFAHAFRDLGMYPEAEVFARRSLEMSEGYERGRLFNTALLASTLAGQRRVEEACATAARAVRMTESVRSVRCAAYISDVGRRLKSFRATGDVRSLYQQMAEAGLPTPSA